MASLFLDCELYVYVVTLLVCGEVESPIDQESSLWNWTAMTQFLVRVYTNFVTLGELISQSLCVSISLSVEGIEDRR